MANNIKLINRELQVPYSQKNIGVQYDNLMDYREFIVPKIINGIDVSGFAFALQINPINKEQDAYYDLLSKTFNDDDTITLRWNIQAHNTIDSGNLNVSLKIFDGESTYQSLITTFTISDDIPAYHEGQLLPPSVFEAAVAECLQQANLATVSATNAKISEDNVIIIKSDIDNIYTDIKLIQTDVSDKKDIVTDNATLSTTESNRAKMEADRAEGYANDIVSELGTKLESSNIIQGNNIILTKVGNDITINSIATGETGTSDYTLLTSKPSINSVEIIGNKTSSDLGLSPSNHTHADLHTHANKSILDGITSALILAWNNAVAHISDTIKHITSAERTLWNTVSSKANSSEVVKLTGNQTISGTITATNLSGSNMGDETNTTIKTKLGTDLSNKVDKITGKSLVSDTEILRLANVVNYDDTSLDGRVDTLETNSLKASNLIQGTNILIDKVGNNITISSSGTVSSVDDVARQSISDLEIVVEGKANTIHTHIISDITNLQATLDGKQPVGSYLTSIPSEYITDTELTNTLSSYALSNDIPDVTDKLEAINIIAGTNVTLDKSGNDVTINATGGTSTGDMLKSVYDTGNIAKDIYDRANHTGTQLAITISDFQTQVSANTNLSNKVDKVSGKSLILDTDIVKLANISGTNTGDETLATIKTKLGNVSEATDGYLTSIQYNSLLSASSDGDMTKAIYDTTNNGIVDNSEKVNGFTVEKNVPSNAVFTDTTYSNATTTTDGLMSGADKVKLNGVAENANNYIHPATHPATMIVEDTTHRFVTDDEKTSWGNKASTDVATTSANGLMPSSDKIKLNGILSGANVKITGIKPTDLAKQYALVPTATVDEYTLVEASGGGGGLTEQDIFGVCVDGVTTLGDKTTSITWYMSKAYIPSSVVSMGNNWFYNAFVISILGGTNFTTVGNSFAKSCAYLTTLSLPTLTTAGNDFAQSCTSLATLSLPALTTVGEYFAFNCPLTHLVVGAANTLTLVSTYSNSFQTWKLPVVDMIAFGTALKTAAAATSIIFGATYWNALSAAQKAIFTGKNYTVTTA